MRLSLRTLLAFEDHIFDQEQHQQLERLIPKHDAASTMLNRIRSTVRNPRLGVPGLVDQREELDPNLVAEYLDQQMPEDIQERFETYSLSSDKYLAEIASVHHILSNVLGEPARTSRECRQHCYDLYRLPVVAEMFSEKQEKEKTESEYPFGSRKLLFDDYLTPAHNSRTSEITGLKEFQGNHSSSASSTASHRPVSNKPNIELEVNHPISSSSNRPELTVFPQHHETENHLPSFNFTPSSQLTSGVAAPPQTNNSVFQTDNIISQPVSFTEQKKIQQPSWAGVFWNWLTAGNPEKHKTEHKTENHREQSQNNAHKNISLWTVLMILLLCSTGWLGWNKVQEEWKNVQQKKETAFINNQPDVTVSAVSDISEPSNKQENTTAISPFPVVGTPEDSAAVTTLQEPPRKSIEIMPPTPVLPATPATPATQATPATLQQVQEKPAQLGLPNTNTNITNITTESPKETFPQVPVAKSANAVNEVEAKTSTKTEPQQHSEQHSDLATSVLPVPPAPSTTTVVKLKSTETPLSEKPMLFAPNPMRHSSTVVIPVESDNSHSPLSSPANSLTQTVAEPEQPTALATPVSVKRREKQEIRNSAGVARVTPTNFETPIRSKPLLVAMPERQPEQFDDQSLIAFHSISAPPKRRDSVLLSPEFVEPNRQDNTVSDLKEPQNSNAWTTSVVNQIPFKPMEKQSLERPIERSMEQQIGRSELVHGNEFTDNQPKPSIALGNTIPMEPVPAASATTPTQHVIPVGEIREMPEIPQPQVLGRVLAIKEPCIVFSASTASDQWEMKRLPLSLHANQYLLTTAPFRAVVELEGGFQVEMVGDSKFCLLEPDENGIAGIFIDYGRLVIRPIFSENKSTTQSLRLQTEKIQGTVHLSDSTSLIFVDTFAEILENTPNESVPNHHHRNLLPQTRPILGLIPETNGKISWQVGQISLVATRQAGVLLIQEKPELGNIQGLPNWLNPLPLPPESEQLATICHRIFDKTNGNCETALNLLIREPSIVVRSFGYRLWGDLGRFDIPLTFLSEAKPDEEPIRQVLVPYFREVMKRDEETVQRLADAIESVRR
ncbi:MAG: hypothetical protein LBC20_11885 [Planctomycetaceae bacterium]|jgi:hypothetical protein|nr:hypothetical protein [Planctomycetaceae bacterium]